MKIIVTGATGFIGAEVLRQALARPEITSVVVLSRKPITGPNAGHSKLKTVLMDNFAQYPDSVLSELAGARACIWALGLAAPGDMDVYRKINVEFPTTAVNAFAKSLAPQLNGDKFRFAYVSGALAVRDQESKPWVLETGRKVRGEAEINMVQAGKDHSNAVETFVARPAMVLAGSRTWSHQLLGKGFSIKVDDLAAALLDTALTGSKEQTLENGDLIKRGKEFLQQ